MSKRSVLDQGRSAQQLREDGTLFGMPVYHTLADALDEIARLRERIVKLEECVGAADAMRFVPFLPSWSKDQYDAARAALGEVEREG